MYPRGGFVAMPGNRAGHAAFFGRERDDAPRDARGVPLLGRPLLDFGARLWTAPPRSGAFHIGGREASCMGDIGNLETVRFQQQQGFERWSGRRCIGARRLPRRGLIRRNGFVRGRADPGQSGAHVNVSPIAPLTCRRYPSAGDSTVNVALSVSTSMIGSPVRIAAPISTNTAASRTVSSLLLMRGVWIRVAICGLWR